MNIIDVRLRWSPVPNEQKNSRFSLLTNLWMLTSTPSPSLSLTCFHRRLTITILWVTNQDLGTSFPKGTPRLHPGFHTSMGQQQKRGLLLQDLEIKSGNSTHSGECHMHACHSPPATMQGRFGVTYFSMRWWDMFSNRHATMKVARCQLP